MIRQIIHIDSDRCSGCGACVTACHEGAIELVHGKARLTREDYCDGLGDCLPECPTGAITFEQREAPAYDEAAVLAARQASQTAVSGQATPPVASGQIGSAETPGQTAPLQSQLRQWPCQIKLAPLAAPYFAGADLLIAADCTAYAYANIHNDFMKDRITLIGCPKLDAVDYSEKLTSILKYNSVSRITVLRMEVPCCGGLDTAVRKAIQNSGKSLSCQVITVSKDGKVLH